MSATSQNKTLFYDYDGFVEKFKPKKTTDDCYTPQPVYDAVLGWVRKEYQLDGVPIVRPFYPDGDYENYDYPEGCVVVDNPPFSIFTKILRWYHAHGIRFFLFAPHLTMAGNTTDTTYILCNCQVIYENGANVNTSFATNLEKENRFVIAPDLIAAIDNAVLHTKQKKTVKKIKLPPNVTSGALLGNIACYNIPLAIEKKECHFIRKCGGYQIFGGGYILSDAAARRVNEARQAADEARRADVPLGAQEQEILRQLNSATARS